MFVLVICCKGITESLIDQKMCRESNFVLEKIPSCLVFPTLTEPSKIFCQPVDCLDLPFVVNSVSLEESSVDTTILNSCGINVDDTIMV